MRIVESRLVELDIPLVLNQPNRVRVDDHIKLDRELVTRKHHPAMGGSRPDTQENQHLPIVTLSVLTQVITDSVGQRVRARAIIQNHRPRPIRDRPDQPILEHHTMRGVWTGVFQDYRVPKPVTWHDQR